MNGNRALSGRGDLWPEVTRKRPPDVTGTGRGFKRRYYKQEYLRISDTWQRKGETDMALYWLERATELG